jgi:hypothetical protein
LVAARPDDLGSDAFSRFAEGGMIETPQQYTQRMLDYVEGRPPLAVQAATADKLESLLKGVPTGRLRERPAPDKWSVSEIVAHLGSPGTPMVAYDQDEWLRSGHYDKRDPRQSVEQFRVLRQGNLALLESLDPEQWKHHGQHAERGPETIEHIARMFAGHDINHLRQIEQILAR